MGAGWEGLGEGMAPFPGMDQARQILAVPHPDAAQALGQGDGLAILIQGHEDGHVFPRATDAHLHAVHQAVEGMGGVKPTGQQLVPDSGPGGLPGERQFDAVLAVVAAMDGQDQGGAVGQGDEPHVHCASVLCRETRHDFVLKSVRPRTPNVRKGRRWRGHALFLRR